MHISHPCAWKANELYENKDFKIRLSDQAIHELIENAQNHSALEKECANIRHIIESGPGILKIEGFPIQSDFEQTKNLYWKLGSMIGTPVSQSPQGDRIMSVMDQGYEFKKGQNEARGSNSSQSLPFHTDICDALAFLCINNAIKGGENYFVSSVAIQNEMAQKRPDLLEVLYQDFYFCPQKFDVGNKNRYFKLPIFSRINQHFSSFYVSLLIELAQELEDLPKLTDTQKDALAYLEELANSDALKISYYQKPGEILILNNHVIYHAREEFVDTEDSKRHLLRLWLSTPNNRPLIEAYRVIYNEVEAGKIRGGVAIAENIK